MSRCHQERREYDQAIALQDRALQIFERAYGSEHPTVATALNNLGLLHQLRGDLDLAEQLHLRTLALRERLGGPDQFPVGLSLFRLATIHRLRGEFTQAETTYQRALATWEKVLGADSPELAWPLVGQGQLALARGRPREAVPLIERALRLRGDDTSKPDRLAEARFALAKAPVAADKHHDRSRVLALAQEAADAYRGLGDSEDGWHRPGRFMQLVPKDKDPQDEKNMTGIEFIVTGAEKNAPGNATGNEEEDQNGKYLTFDKFPKPPHITATDPQSGAPVDYTIAIERATRDLPFTITLETEDFHPGTDMARAFQSKIIVTDGATSWPALIQMNQPLRYRGYTLYQSSFDMSGDKPYTILTVVENKGRIFPYIATIIIAFGVILHLGLRLGRKQASHA